MTEEQYDAEGRAILRNYLLLLRAGINVVVVNRETSAASDEARLGK